MKLLRVGPKGGEHPALLHSGGSIRDLTGIVPDIGGAHVSPEAIGRIRSLDPAALPIVSKYLRVGPCLSHIGKIVCVGLNYRDHAMEANQPIPTEPVLFLKATSAVSGPYDPIVRPKGSQKLDWEVELGVVIGTRASYVTRAQAPAMIAGYLLANDVSERGFQLERAGQWTKGKSFDSAAPLGPWFVTSDEVVNPQSLELYLEVNGRRRQFGTTADMIFDIPTIVSYISQFMTLMPGDLVLTGTPAGVGAGSNPPTYLQDDDKVVAKINGLGEQVLIVRQF
jgi:2,4-diketo-3-deoxy-L-fuconate hydrolase